LRALSQRERAVRAFYSLRILNTSRPNAIG
jgi:hypothetical protein